MLMRWLVAAVVITFSPAAHAKEPVVIGETRHLRSTILNEDRTFKVHLPLGYETSAERYPVLFVLDAQNHFTHAVGSASYLMDQGEIPPLIVVGLDSTVRVRDFTPTDWPQAWIGGGGAVKFRSFLATELIPEIDKSYRTDGFRVVSGHSASGQFALYCLETQPTLFQGYFALSPSLDWDGNLPINGLEKAFDQKPTIQAFAFVARSDDRDRPLADFNRLVEVFQKKAPSGLRWKSQAYDLETHGSIALVGTIDALRALYAGWRVPEGLVDKGLPAVETYFGELSKTYGRPVPLTETVVNELAYRALEKKQIKDALALFQRNVAAHPGSANAFDGLADALEADGQTAAAVAAQTTCVKLARQASHPSLGSFEKKLKRLKPTTAPKKAPASKP
jgi:uncharacterized protein